MPDDLDLSRSIEALTGSDTTDQVGRFRLDLRTGRWTWSDELLALHDLAPGAAQVAPTLLALRHPDDRGADQGPVTAAIAAARPFASAFRIVSPAGRTRTVLVVGEPERDADGAVIAVRGHLVELAGAARRESELQARAEQLETALRTRPVIEQAKGMLMLMHRCSEEAAFRLLIGVSQASNRKLRDVAAEIVEALAGDDPLPEPTARVLAAELAQLARRDGADQAARH
ncbi:ANTAR domain-containing response regulator [Pseudonocardia acidicola]|uniref:ANTAR domain-containing protein n=1 Tax=Pseudonocardia acidicola TaxID=2724939 RepID=A0ABX1SDR3_9PSEU|nr:ANTAR domain-containing protein [Pseudonocardia acidicola]NMH99715.1 ANTAR domain-containing protein [Pseudonocardia acidicola]